MKNEIENWVIRDSGRKVLLSRVRHASSFWARLKGLLGTNKLTSEQGLLLTPCMEVHTIGMRYPIDIVFLNRELQVIKIIENLVPYRAARHSCAYQTLEMASGEVAKKGIQVDDILAMEKIHVQAL